MSFDAVAWIYGALETIVFGNALQRARTAFAGALRDRRNALLAGEGNGRSLGALLTSNRDLRVTCVDSSAKMIELGRKRLRDSQQLARVEFVHADLLEAELPRSDYDLVVTNFFLDCFDEDELPLVVAKIGSFTAPVSTWIISEFALPSRGPARVVGKVLIAVMYRFFWLTAGISASRLPHYRPLLEQHGFRCVKRREFVSGIVRAELWERTITALALDHDVTV
jgi:ubiquinone/menaquinone biosynthesis C-methylase UbiE